MIYLIIMFFAVGILLFQSKKKKVWNGIVYILSFFITLLPHSLRYGIGTDYFYTYVPYFRWIGLGRREFSEIGFNFINRVIYNFTGDYRVLFFVCSFFTLFLMYRGIKENSKSVPISILMLFLSQFYFYSMNLVRQSLAMAIIFLGFKYLKNNKIFKYILSCCCAMLFHSSAVVMILFGILARMKFKIKTKFFTLLLVVVLSPLLGKFIYEIIVNYTSYGWYYTSDFMNESIPSTLVVFNVILFLISLWYDYKNKSFEDISYALLSNFSFLCIIVILLSSNIPLVFRFIRYLTMFQILFVPALIKFEVKAKNRMVLSFILYPLCFIIMIYQILILGGEGVYPYVSIFD